MKKYIYITFYVSNASCSASFPSYNVAITKFGLYFSNNVINSLAPILNYVPQITSPTGVFLKDTLNWMQVSGTYIAQGGERYITLGNFSDDANTDTMQFATTSINHGAYYYLDDVSVMKCNVGVEELSNEEDVVIYPNPATASITLTTHNQQLKTITIYNVLGCEILRDALNDKSATVDVSNFSNGLYFLSVQYGNKTISRKFVKE